MSLLFPSDPYLFCRFILNDVSRTFALNIRFLKNEEYWIILVSYLICRVLDTIEDAKNLTIKQKKIFLEEFILLIEGKTHDPTKVKTWSKRLKKIKAQKAEKILLERAHDLLFVYHQQNITYRNAIQKPIKEMAKGMVAFITKYPKKAHLNTEKELYQYCYYVAGTVGKLITNIFKKTIKNPKKQAILDKYQIDFGQGLQRINIAKDFLKDQKRHWCYIPKTLFQKENLPLKDFYNHTSPESSKKVMLSFLEKTQSYLNKALSYIKAIPFWHLRKRIFCLLSLFLATRTLRLLKKQTFEKTFESKISRFEVKASLFLSICVAWNNTLMSQIYKISYK